MLRTKHVWLILKILIFESASDLNLNNVESFKMIIISVDFFNFFSFFCMSVHEEDRGEWCYRFEMSLSLSLSRSLSLIVVNISSLFLFLLRSYSQMIYFNLILDEKTITKKMIMRLCGLNFIKLGKFLFFENALKIDITKFYYE